ncbi:MAG: phage Gp37/Gp68 family protein [Gammaproteobacteria bacterium]|nr:phage Gp37/Gp68 family protein [Gammaproteobacteria bacterium]
MAETTNISWCDATFNPWWGCTKVGPGCDHCYAEVLDNRFKGGNWGKGSKPRAMSDNNWKTPYKLQKKAVKEGHRLRVFCGSMCDVFDKNAPAGQRERLWQVIRETPDLDWLLLTKRAPNIKKYLPGDWGEGYSNVWLGVTVENIKHGYPRIDHLRKVPAVVRFLSCEPLLEDIGTPNLKGIGWLIVGGESGVNARPMKRFWFLGLQTLAVLDNIPFFFKQWGGTGKDNGGSLIDGVEVKQWPK